MSNQVATAFKPSDSSSERLRRITDYYSAATLDYGAWSRDFHMHFGYWRWGLNPFQRESMLRELSLQVMWRLCNDSNIPTRVADLGGGTGATARMIVDRWEQAEVDVITLCPNQIEIGKKLSYSEAHKTRIHWHCCDYEHSELPSAHYDSVCLIESSCYAEGKHKRGLMREILRLLKPGGSFALVDAMLKRPLPEAGWIHAWRRKMYRTWCDAWAVPELCEIDLLAQATREFGGEICSIEDWSYRIAPSVAHAPFLVIYHFIMETIKAGGRLTSWRYRHLLASFLSPWIGLLERNFVYAAITGRRLA